MRYIGALMVLLVLLFVVQKREGCLYPSLETIGKLARMSKPTVVKAIGTLVLLGFLTVYRRIKVRVLTAHGDDLCDTSDPSRDRRRVRSVRESAAGRAAQARA
jgi:hypothetical protein